MGLRVGQAGGTLAGRLDGDSLILDDWKEGPNYGRSWKAATPGITKITLAIRADGERVVLGVDTVGVT